VTQFCFLFVFSSFFFLLCASPFINGVIINKVDLSENP